MKSVFAAEIKNVACLVLAAFLANAAFFPSRTVEAQDSSPIPTELAKRLPAGGFRDVKWEDPCPGKWTTVDVTTKGVKPGAADVSKPLQALVDELEKPTILSFPAGTYHFTGISIRKSNIIIKGAGPDKTLIKPPYDGAVFGTLGKGGWYEWPDLGKEWQPRKITADVPAGASVVQIADTEALKAGDTVIVVENLEKFSYKAAKRGRGGIFVITKVDGKAITLNLPLAIGLEKVAERDGLVAKIDPVRNVGFEGFRVEMPAKGQKGKKGSILHIKRSQNVYVRNVESFNPTGHHVMVAYSHRVVVENCFFDEAKVKGGGGYGYGANIRDLTTLCKVENCVLKDLRHFLSTEVGASYCIYAYNFSVDRLRDFMHSDKAPKEKVREKWLTNKSLNKIGRTFVTADTVAHGNFPHHILLEGNVFYNGCIDVSHKTNGPHFLFRNKALGQPKNFGYWQEGCGIVIMGENDGQVVVGNYLANDSKIHIQKHRAPRTAKDLLIGGNVISGKVEWGPFPPETKFPPSLYLKKKPSFWPADLAWPPYGPDVKDPLKNKLPAQVRYESRR